ncbi:hypothetical protein CONPUDRAFT_70696 [Coniophora puteana RWD-64-598 SS2]|uniref:Uncharacterized protein n=1 Tax=Coniophora puteana (strain RWD-64-598) TaxID=741705 RepID=A0A5M3MXC4_CONPW|nr:uncharacterized protein CONPUDRAFT_70696 [Coniophora puteana RWD-64-598 SS2]EIW83738.1 hypothetical protein CONPUDRAFT_70696 [Coniophora puteana RWD-64-598 SS2]
MGPPNHAPLPRARHHSQNLDTYVDSLAQQIADFKEDIDNEFIGTKRQVQLVTKEQTQQDKRLHAAEENTETRFEVTDARITQCTQNFLALRQDFQSLRQELSNWPRHDVLDDKLGKVSGELQNSTQKLRRLETLVLNMQKQLNAPKHSLFQVDSTNETPSTSCLSHRIGDNGVDDSCDDPDADLCSHFANLSIEYPETCTLDIEIQEWKMHETTIDEALSSSLFMETVQEESWVLQLVYSLTAHFLTFPDFLSGSQAANEDHVQHEDDPPPMESLLIKLTFTLQLPPPPVSPLLEPSKPESASVNSDIEDVPDISENTTVGQTIIWAGELAGTPGSHIHTAQLDFQGIILSQAFKVSEGAAFVATSGEVSSYAANIIDNIFRIFAYISAFWTLRADDRTYETVSTQTLKGTSWLRAEDTAYPFSKDTCLLGGDLGQLVHVQTSRVKLGKLFPKAGWTALNQTQTRKDLRASSVFGTRGLQIDNTLIIDEEEPTTPQRFDTLSDGFRSRVRVSVETLDRPHANAQGNHAGNDVVMTDTAEHNAHDADAEGNMRINMSPNPLSSAEAQVHNLQYDSPLPNPTPPAVVPIGSVGTSAAFPIPAVPSTPTPGTTDVKRSDQPAFVPTANGTATNANGTAWFRSDALPPFGIASAAVPAKTSSHTEKARLGHPDITHKDEKNEEDNVDVVMTSFDEKGPEELEKDPNYNFQVDAALAHLVNGPMNVGATKGDIAVLVNIIQDLCDKWATQRPSIRVTRQNQHQISNVDSVLSATAGPGGKSIYPRSGVPTHRCKETLTLQVRVHALTLLGRHSKSDPFPDPPTQQELTVFEKFKRNGPSATNFRVELPGQPLSTWNREAAAVFADDFITKEMFECKEVEDVKKAFTAHFVTLRSQFLSLQEENEEVDESKAQRLLDEEKDRARDARRRWLRNRRARACLAHPDLKRYIKIWKKLPMRAMSGDETDHNGEVRYAILGHTWRSSLATEWLRVFDCVHLSTRFHADGRPKRGKLPHYRVPSRRVEHPDQPEPRLPINFYDEHWYASLSELEKKRLHALPPLDMTHTEDVLAYALPVHTCFTAFTDIPPLASLKSIAMSRIGGLS